MWTKLSLHIFWAVLYIIMYSWVNNWIMVWLHLHNYIILLMQTASKAICINVSKLLRVKALQYKVLLIWIHDTALFEVAAVRSRKSR